MSNATNPSPPKRARVHEQTTSTPSPSEAANSLIASAVASLPIPLQSTCLDFAKQSLAIFKQIQDRKQSIASLENESYIPRSARCAFTLNASKKVMETAEFLTHKQIVNDLVAKFQSDIKDQIIAVANLELARLERQLAEITFSLIGYLSKTLLITHNMGLNANDDNVIAVCHVAIFHLQQVYIPTTLLSKADIIPLLLPYSTSELMDTLDNVAWTLYKPTADTVIASITSLCIEPSTLYLEQVSLNSKYLQVLAISKSVKSDALATDATIAIDDEPTMEPQLLQNLVAKEVEKTIDKKLGAISQQLQQLSLKGVRGTADNDTSASASLKKKLENDKKAAAGRILAAAKKQQENNKKSAAGRKAAAAARDSAVASTKQQKDAKRKKSSRKSN